MSWKTSVSLKHSLLYLRSCRQGGEDRFGQKQPSKEDQKVGSYCEKPTPSQDSSAERTGCECQRPGAAPLWGWKMGLQNGSPLGLGGWGCQVASRQGQAARAAIQLLSLFFSSRFPSKATVPAVVALTVRRLIFHKQQSSPPPSCCPPFVLKRSWAPWVVTKTPYPPLQGCVPRSTDTRLIVPTPFPPSERGGGAG